MIKQVEKVNVSYTQSKLQFLKKYHDFLMAITSTTSNSDFVTLRLERSQYHRIHHVIFAELCVDNLFACEVYQRANL